MADDPSSDHLDDEAVGAADAASEGAGAHAGPDAGLRGPAWIGARVPAGSPLPVAGTWRAVENPNPDDGDGDDQPRAGELRSFGRGDIAPPTARGGDAGSWRLEHLAGTVAADHRFPYPGDADPPAGSSPAGPPATGS